MILGRSWFRLPGEEMVLVLAPSVRGCSESIWVPGVVVRPGTAPQDIASWFQSEAMPWGCFPRRHMWVAGADGQQELLLHFIYRASTKLKERQKLCLKGDWFADFEEREVFRKKTGNANSGWAQASSFDGWNSPLCRASESTWNMYFPRAKELTWVGEVSTQSGGWA